MDCAMNSADWADTPVKCLMPVSLMPMGRVSEGAGRVERAHAMAPLVTASTQAMVFHALGGSPDWFKRVVIPHIRYWAAHVYGIAVTIQCPSSTDSALRPAIDYLIEQGLGLLESWRALPAQSQGIQRTTISPATKLMKLHQAIIDGMWCLLQSVEIEGHDGSVWTLGDRILQSWFEQHGSPFAQLRFREGVNKDIWIEAIHVLLNKEIWGQSPSGRWLPAAPCPLLLWPLAGKDLQHTLLDLGYPEFSSEYLRRSLKQWGYTNPDCLSGELFPWIRPDQKTFFGLRASPRLIGLLEGLKS